MTMAAMTGGAKGGRAKGALQLGHGTVDEAQLLDVLYEILAQGGDPNGELTAAEVEVFLHEHARQPKSHAEMLAFFERHRLSTNPDVYATDPELGEIASGLHRERGPASSVFPLDETPAPEDAPVAEEPITGAHPIPRASAAVVEASPFVSPAPFVQPAYAGAPLWLRVAVATLGLCIVAGAALSYGRARELEEQLAQARMQQHSTDSALTVLEQRAGQLQIALDESERGRRALDTGLKAYIEQETTQRAAEQAALQKLLGPRYQTLTQKALAETL